MHCQIEKYRGQEAYCAEIEDHHRAALDLLKIASVDVRRAKEKAVFRVGDQVGSDRILHSS